MLNIVEDVYLPKKQTEDLKNSNAYKLAKANNIDTDILEGKEPDPNAGEIKFEPVSEADQRIYLKDVTDFITKDVPRDSLIGITKGLTNAGVILNNITNLIGINPDSSYEFIQDKLMSQKERLSDLEQDSTLVNKLISVLPQGGMYTVPIYKKFKAAGVPTSYAFPISAAIGETLAFDKTESFLVDSKMMRTVKESMNIPPDSSAEEVYDRLVQVGEYALAGTILEKIFSGVMTARKLKADQGQQGSIAVGGGASSGAAVQEMTSDSENVTESEEKKNLNFDDQSMVPGTVNEYGFEKTAGLVPVFKSVLKETAKNIPNKGSGQQILGQIANTPGVKQQELKWTGLDDFLKSKKTVTKDEVKEYLEANQINISEVQFPRTGKDFGMYNDMLESAEQRKIDWSNSRQNLIGGDQRTNFDNVYLSVFDENGKYTNERISFALFSQSPTGRMIRGFNDINTFAVDVDAIKKQYPGSDPNTVDFYVVRDITNDQDIAINKRQFEDPSFNDIVKTVTRGEPVGKRYELQFINNMSHDELEKFALETEIRDLQRARNIQEGTTRYGQYTEPGGDDYKELVFKYKQKDNKGFDKGIPAETDVTRYDDINNLDIQESPHFNEMNELAHVRFKTRNSKGKKILSVEEMQSDLVQAVKQSNEVADRNADALVTDFPFKNNWYELVLKRLIRYGADNNFDAIAIPKGKVVKDRYNLGFYVDELQIGSYDPKNKYIGLEGYEFGDTQKYLTLSDNFTFEEAEKRFGKDLFNRIIEKAKTLKQADYDNGNNTISFNKQLSFGGEGKDRLYDKTIPSFLKKYGKKWNTKVYEDDLIKFTDEQLGKNTRTSFNSPIQTTIIEITPEMKQSVQQDSQALFNIFGIGTAAGVTTDAVLDNKRNNIISN